MRLQLLLIFLVIIAIAVGTSWFLAVRTTDTQFALLVSENNERQAEYVAPLLVSEYQKLGSWDRIQTELVQQVRQQRPPSAIEESEMSINVNEALGTISIQLEQPNGVQQAWNYNVVEIVPPPFSFNAAPPIAYTDNNQPPQPVDLDDIPIAEQQIDWDTLDNIFGPRISEYYSGNYAPDIPNFPPIEERMYAVDPQLQAELFQNNVQNSAIVIEQSGTSLMANELVSNDQRAIVVDTDGNVVIDSESALLGERVDNLFRENGVELRRGESSIGTFIITSVDGVYTVEQSFFLQKVREGLLIGGGASMGIALLLAIGIAYRITRPIRSLTAATEHIQAGQWGYQVDVRTRNEIGQLGDAFNQMSRHLDEQRCLRSRLVDDLSHELNTPLSLMRLELQGMVDGLQTPTEAAEHLSQELHEVSELVADLIFLANQDAARSPKMEWVEINDLVSSAVRRFDGSASGDLELRFMPCNTEPLIYADGDLVQRAISNLISNAIRYTGPNGEITLTVKTVGESVEVVVTDTGEGIPSEHLPHIFERFYRVDSSRTRQSGGRGLGLAIVKQIMEQHQGKIRVESQPDLGSTFTLVWSAKNAPI
jgi:signal transduction histidine kinase